MKRKNKYVSKPWFFIVAVVVILFTVASFFGLDDYYGDMRSLYVKGAGDIRWGIDISGGVEAIFAPDLDSDNDGKDDIDPDTISNSDMDSAKQVIETRMLYNNITDYEVYTDYDNKQIIVRFPWQSDDESYDPMAAVDELGETAMLTFYKGSDNTGEKVLQGAADIKGASYGGYQSDESGKGSYVVSLELTSQGATKFAAATKAQIGKSIAIYMDDTLLSAPTVNTEITDGKAIITGMATAEEATELAQKINAGALPFALSVDNSKLQVISPILGSEALNVMLIAGIIAFIIICLMMIIRYRLPGTIACVALAGQAGLMIAAISGFFPGTDSFTMTLPGIAGIILAIGFGIDANVIVAERIKEEFKKGKTIDGAIQQGYSNAFSSILDGNITNVIVALVLLAAFGTPDSILGQVFGFLFPFLSSSVTGNIYSFGYTLIVGVIANFIMGIFASRLMLMGISRFKFLRKPSLYCAPKAKAEGVEEKPKFWEKFDFAANLKKYSIVIVAIMLVGVILTAIFGIGFDINFAGGSRFTYSYTGDVDKETVKQVITDKLGIEPTISESTDYSSDATKLVISFSGDVTEKIDDAKLEAILKEANASEHSDHDHDHDTESTTSNTTSSEVASSDTSSVTSSEVTSSTTESTDSSTTSSTASTTTSSTASATTSSEEETANESMVGIQTAMTYILQTNFKDNNFKSLDGNTVNPTLAGAFLVKSLFALVLAGALIVLYIGIRFRKIGGISAGICAFAALFHDVIIAFFACVIFGLEIDTNFFAVALTLFGYSLNATIVIFDRVRENRKFYPTLSVREQVNKSIRETIARSIFTSLTTFAAIISIVIVAEFFGVTALRTFAIPMAVGVIAGCVSSVFLAGPLWVKWSEHKASKEPAKKAKK